MDNSKHRSMGFIEWKDSLSVGVKDIDQQHRQLVLILNRLHQAMSEGKGKEVLSGILADLADYTITHFYTEEKYMQKYHYQDMSKHKKEHDQFVAKVADFQRQYEAGSVIISIDILKFIKEWLINHIMKTDKILGEYLAQVS